MTLHEPATFFTDLLLAVLGAWLALRLHRGYPPTASRRWWIAAMSSMALSALVGGFYHGFAPELPPQVEAFWWRCVLWIICGLGFAMGMSLLREFSHSNAWRTFLILKLLISSVIVAWNPSFLVAIADYGLAMLAWTIASFASRRLWRSAMLAGTGLSFMAAVVQQSQRGLTEFFNHNDLFHLVQALALIAFYRAGTDLNGTRTSFDLSAQPSAGSSPG
ncbi:hypothetical protein OJ996_12915 [Luteolibacter sp. GHJ8]|uniref:Uncharacterized protein n=1 Tax=Luteolibacter rhizosphaerae TaxID=2989719 RepID=A0ABT3G3R7_9BACT|nr:hypothetical protein [Luteolibacter rhizosphaerae]MCW1914482.1 hypothetical protein [Luteolibacter rhizosphaerae]